MHVHTFCIHFNTFCVEFDVFDIVDDHTFEVYFTQQGINNHKFPGGIQHKMVNFDLGMKFHIKNDDD